MRRTAVPPVDYPLDVLAAPPKRPPAPPRDVTAVTGLEVCHAASRHVGRVVAIEDGAVLLRDRDGRTRAFPLVDDFLVGGLVSRLRPPAAAPADPRTALESRRTASGSLRAAAAAASTARASRIWVEGLHDAELVERVWGDELRELAIVVEPLGGVDHLERAVDAFGPGPDRRLGVLVDHLVPGSKEARIAARVAGAHVLVTGHPYVDVWAAVRPEVLRIPGWPDVPRGTPGKEGVCAALGGAAAPPTLFRTLLRRVRSYRDLEVPLVGAVEELLDFLTA